MVIYSGHHFFDLPHQHIMIVSFDSQKVQVQNGVNGDQETHHTLHNDYVWDSDYEQESMIKDDPSLDLSICSSPFTQCCNIFSDSSITITSMDDSIFNDNNSDCIQE